MHYSRVGHVRSFPFVVRLQLYELATRNKEDAYRIYAKVKMQDIQVRVRNLFCERFASVVIGPVVYGAMDDAIRGLIDDGLF